MARFLRTRRWAGLALFVVAVVGIVRAFLKGPVAGVGIASHLGSYWPYYVLLIALTLALLPSGLPQTPKPHETLPTRPAPALNGLDWRWPALGVLGVVVGAVLASIVLFYVTDGASGDATAARIDVIRTGLSIGAGLAGGLVLALAVRRQMLGERTQHTTELDASARRVLEQYVKSVDQLGSDRPAVRLGGLYALERLGQANESERQSVVDVICAYLRLPHIMPDDLLAVPAPAAGARTRTDLEPYEELEVRIVAQRILSTHLRIGPQFWSGMNVDLAGAVLLNFSLADLDMASFRVLRAEFKAREQGHSIVRVDDSVIEHIAQCIHEDYVAGKRDSGDASDDPALNDWANLDESYRVANRKTARHVPEKLSAINCGLTAATSDAPSFAFSHNELKILAEIEHERWLAERRSDGWTLGERKLGRKTNPSLVPFVELPDSDRRENMKREGRLPEILFRANYEIRRLPGF